jgi:predicted DNA-binding antitoxin AbrB/MazE fold protein
MRQVLDATYKGGVLVPDRSLGAEMDGRRFKVILVEEDRASAKREDFFQFVRAHAFHLPKDYRFDRAELYER